jgi:hypothetical protein
MTTDISTETLRDSDAVARAFFVRLGVTPHHPAAVRGADGHINVSAELTGDDALAACRALIGHPMVTGFTYYGPDADCDERHAITASIKRAA